MLLKKALAAQAINQTAILKANEVAEKFKTTAEKSFFPQFSGSNGYVFGNNVFQP